MASSEGLPVIAHAIQLAVAPVFLLTGIAAFLSVNAGRLARIIDRSRFYEQAWKTLDEKARERGRDELKSLERRRQFASWSINLSIVSALLICVVIAALFVDTFLQSDVKWLAAGLFINAMIAMIGSLLCFFQEVSIATRTVRIMTERFLQ